MDVVVAGATGLIGCALCGLLDEGGHAVTALVRNPGGAAGRLSSGVRVMSWQHGTVGPWCDAVASADAVVNLAGEPIAGRRWSAEQKRRLRASRLDTTRALVRAIGSRPRPGGTLVNASAVGYYGDGGDVVLTEEALPGTGFLALLCRDWEAEARAAQQHGTRVILLRTGHVLARGGGMLAKLSVPFRWFLGGPLGSGRQWMPWIHVADAVRMIAWAIETETASGPINVCAPEPVRMSEFARQLGAVMGRPAALRVPAFALRLAMGELAGALLGGQRAVPAFATRLGFRWQHPALEPALRAALRR